MMALCELRQRGHVAIEVDQGEAAFVARREMNVAHKNRVRSRLKRLMNRTAKRLQFRRPRFEASGVTVPRHRQARKPIDLMFG